MAELIAGRLGKVVSVRRYPVKSMAGEELIAIEITDRGLLGDRAFALVDDETGKVASAKNPRRWPDLLQFRAEYLTPPRDVDSPAPVRITLPDGQSVTTDQEEVEAKLSAAVGRPVRLARSSFEGAKGEGFSPEYDWLPNPGETFDVPFPTGTFFDGATVHIVTTASLDRLKHLTPESRFDARRFRPNFVIEPTDFSDEFIEENWIGQTLRLGEASLRIDRPTPRCVMTTVAQGDLPKDPAVLRTTVQYNKGNLGVYATVVKGGRVARGDALVL